MPKKCTDIETRVVINIIIVHVSVAISLINTSERRHSSTLLLVQGPVMHWPVFYGCPTRVSVEVSDGVLHPVLVVTVGEVLVSVSTPTLVAVLCSEHGCARTSKQIPELKTVLCCVVLCCVVLCCVVLCCVREGMVCVRMSAKIE